MNQKQDVQFVAETAGGEELSVGWRRAIIKTKMSTTKTLKIWREPNADTGAEWTPLFRWNGILNFVDVHFVDPVTIVQVG